VNAPLRTAQHAPAHWLAQLDACFPQRLVPLASGGQVAMRECGRGSGRLPLVLLHGISSGAASWLPAVMALEQPQHVLAWDAPGYGESTPLADAAPTADAYAPRVHEWLDALQVGRCVLAGHSLGALMATAYARLHPQRVARLVLVSPASGYGDRPADAERTRRQRLDALAERGVEGLAERIDERLLSPAADADARGWVRWNAARLHPAGYSQAVEVLCGSTLQATPAGLPVEVHCGAEDVVTPPAACEAAARRLGATFHLIPGAGHASPVEQPVAVARLLAAAAQRTQEPQHA